MLGDGRVPYINSLIYSQGGIHCGNGPRGRATIKTSPRPSNHSHVTRTELPVTPSADTEVRASLKDVKKIHRYRTIPGLATGSASPSDTLLAALGPISQPYTRPDAFSNKLDLSYHTPLSLRLHSRNRMRRRVRNQRSLRIPKTTVRFALVQYIQKLHSLVMSCSQAHSLLSESPEFDNALLGAFDDETLTLLEAKGWHVPDLMSWTWILTADSSEKAAIRLMMLASPPARTSGAIIPTFVFLLLLRRTDMTARALKLLLIHAWDRLQGRPSTGWATKSNLELENAAIPNIWPGRMGDTTTAESCVYQKMSETTIMIMIVRLLRHCRKLWPAACVSIATMLTKYVNGTSLGNNAASATVLPVQTSARLAALYNKTLSLLSLPSSMNPFQSVAHHQRAQFRILRRMDEFEPALAIDREGYRAVTRVQLAHRKTLREREWTDMKAKSWPPWKEEKLGIDVSKGPEYGVTRAGESMYRLKEAGYAPQDWESAAEVLAGWDTDRSPTIQTRTRFQKPLLPRRVMPSGISARPERDGDLWAARIRATRTLDEGWVCFLAYKAEKGHPSQAPYHAMFEKLIFEGKRRRKSDGSGSMVFAHDSTSNVLAGDGKEVLPNPKDPRMSIHVRTPPPSIEGFFDNMIEAKVHASGRFLAFLLSHAESFGAGVKYLRASSLPPRIIHALLNQDLFNDSTTRAELESMPDYLFAAFVRFLSRFAPRSSRQTTNPIDQLSTRSSSPGDTYISITRLRAKLMKPLLHAFHLMACRKPYYRPPWNSLLSALARAGTVVDSNFPVEGQDVQDILTWNVVCDLLHQMRDIGLDLDLQGFQIVCVALEKAAFAGERLIQASKKPMVSTVPSTHQSPTSEKLDHGTRIRIDAEHVLLHGLPRVKMIFKYLVTSDMTQGETTGSDIDELSKWLEDHDTLDPGALLPRLLEVPTPSQLHAFIRVLGLRADYVGLVDLVQWMSSFAPELKAVTDEAANGGRMMRRCLVAVRVFMERCWICTNRGAESDGEEHGGHEEGAPEALLEKGYEIIEGQQEWGGWPSDEEVDEYCRKGRFV